MKPEPSDTGTINALMIRMKEFRLPRAQRIREWAERGETLRQSDNQFLHRVFGKRWQPLTIVPTLYARLFCIRPAHRPTGRAC